MRALFDALAETNEAFLKVLRSRLPDPPDVEVDEVHREHVIGEEGELVIAVGVVRFEGIPLEGDVFLLTASLEGERQIVAQDGGVFHPFSLTGSGPE